MLTKVSPVKFAAAAEPHLRLAYRRYLLQLKEPSKAASTKKPKNCTLLVSHATGLCKEVYEPLLRHISLVDGEALAMDLRNHGDSSVANSPLFENGKATTVAFKDYSEDTLALLKSLNISNQQKPLIGIGHSAGATGLLLAEATYPGTFSAIIAIDPVLSTIDLHKEPSAVPKNNTAAILDNLANMVKNRRANWSNREMARKHFFGRGMYADWDNDALDAYIQYGLREVDPDAHLTLKMPPKAESEGYLSGKHLLYSSFESLSKIKIPVLFIGSTKSNINLPDVIQTITKQCVNGKSVILKELGHMMAQERPDIVAAEIDQFISSLTIPSTQTHI
ncbi:Alpha/Beta hydrolase protein [Syncephalis fuscata]|nr:Alpha/Beta hydrolase protein [Syncephalis fuscata]